jgi:acyl carrier protein
MTNNETSIESRLKNLIVDRLRIAEADILPEKAFIEDLGADSLDLTELYMSVEEEFNIEISDGDAENIRTVGDVIQYLEKKLAT